MKVLALTDIHGSYDRAENILRSEQPYDILVVGGDLTTHGTSEEAERAIRRFGALGTPVLLVGGNMDPPKLEDTFKALSVSIHGRGIVHNGIGFFGVAGSPPTPMHTPNEIDEAEILRRAEAGWKDVENATIKVFVPHAPPHKTSLDRVFLGMHVGSVSVRAFIDRRQPDVVICGHIHEARGIQILGRTQVVNCGPAGKGEYAVIHIAETITIETKG